MQCGVKIQRTPEGYRLSQASYEEGPINSSRRKNRQEATTDREKTLLRALLGGLSWHAQQVAPHVAAEVGLLLSEVSQSSVETMITANILLSHTRSRKDHELLIHAFVEGEKLGVFTWVDAASQNRRDGRSTQGILVGIGPESMLAGDLGRISLMAWHSSKIDRICRSPGAAEAQAAVNGDDAGYFARFRWSELEYGLEDVRQADECVRRVPGCLVTDSRNVFDRLATEVLVIKGAERKTSIELLGLKESQQSTQLRVRWVHSEAQLANALTKAGPCKELELYYKMNQSRRVVEDPMMRSARRRRQDGMEPLEESKKPCEVKSLCSDVQEISNNKGVATGGDASEITRPSPAEATASEA